MKRAVVAALLVVAAACGGNSPSGPTGPSTPDVLQLAGVWSGVIKNSTPPGPDGTARFTLAQAGTTLSGNWGTQYADPSLNNSGTVSGTVAGQSASFVLQPSNPQYCPYQVTAYVSGGTMIGTFAAFNCSIAVAGSFTASR